MQFYNKNNRDLIFGVIIFMIFSSGLLGQEAVLKQRLSRGKMWITSLPNGSLEKDQTTRYTWLLNYPGYYTANNEVGGGWDITRIFNVAQINGENVGWEWRNQRTGSEVYAVQQNELYQNYNLIDPSLPEEYMEGVMASFPLDAQSRRHMAYTLEARTMVWGLPEYDDFVLIKCKLTNTDSVTFENFYYGRTVSPTGPSSPLNTSYDAEYMWDAEVSSELGFVFYDDTSWPPDTKGDSSAYVIHPGNLTGDRGNPGNIEQENSRDRKLYHPFLYAFSFVPQGLTPNKNGEKKVWRNIISRSGDAPAEEIYPGHEAMTNWETYTNFIAQEQPEMSWREANAQYQEGDLAGSRWERYPRYLYSIGPYDIAPGESIEWIEIFLAGQMDRNVTIMGDTTATLHFVEEGLVNLKQNWQAAKELITNNFVMTKNVPPPTPADAPLLGNSNELVAVSAAGMVSGLEKAGVNLTFKGVHQGYTDPVTGEADFAGYNIYQSSIDVEGPWKKIGTLTVQRANELMEDGLITYFQPADISIPYRYAVTSFDTQGSECSIMSAYISDAVTAKSFSTDNLSQVRIVPNPFRQQSGFANVAERKRLAFINIPEKCIIRIYTVALDLVRTINHEGGGETTWGSTSSSGNDYLLTDFAMNVSPGVYIYHLESQVAGHEGESTVGKIFIIK